MLFQFSLSSSYIARPQKLVDNFAKKTKKNLYDPIIYKVYHYQKKNIEDDEQGINHVKVKNDAAPWEDKELASSAQCTCQYFRSFDLLCRHIFAVINIFQAKQNIFSINKRWLKDEFSSGNLGKFKKKKFQNNYIETI